MATLLPLLALHLTLTALPAVAAALAAARRGVTLVPVLLAIALVASGVVAMFAFWLYFATPLAGKLFSYAVPLASSVVLVSSLRASPIDPQLARRLATPLALWILGSTFLVFLGFAHGGIDSPIQTAQTRFMGYMLPSDNEIPRYFADWFYMHGHHGRPPLFPPDWLASDRPPLQIGYVLSQRPLAWDRHEINYQLLAVGLQQLWIVGVWALLDGARVGRLTRGLAAVTLLVSDVAIVNGFFVWPKLLPAAMLLAAAALVATPLWDQLRHKLWASALVASLFGLAMLGHGSSVFGIIPLAGIAALRGLPNRRWLAVCLIVGAALLVPWSLYQRYGDPPGNRLTKEALAGAPNSGGGGTLQSIADAYRRAGLGGTLHNKAENFVTMTGGGPMVSGIGDAIDAARSGHLAAAIDHIRVILFFDLLPSFGLLAIVPLLMLAARRRHASSAEWTFSVTCYALLAVGGVAWGLLMFGNAASTAVLHQGSYALPLLGLCGCVAGVRAAFPRFGIWLIAASALSMIVIHAPSLDPPQGTSYSPLAVTIALASLAGFSAVALRAA